MLRYNTINTLFYLLIFISPFTYSKSVDVNSIALETLSGETTNLTELSQGKPMYLKFWATWCQTCLQQMPHFEEVQQTYSDEIKVIGVNVWINESITLINDEISKQGITMPIVIDMEGKLANAFDLVGTPLHVVINEKGQLVHKGHDASKALDTILSLTAKGKSSLNASENNSNNPDGLSSFLLPSKDLSAVLFTATWCDQYWQDSRPSMAKNCAKSIPFLNTMAVKYNEINWQLVASRLWVGQQELIDFTKTHQVKVPSVIDTTNKIFIDNKVTKFPVLLVFNNGQEIGRIDDFADKNLAQVKLDKLFAMQRTIK